MYPQPKKNILDHAIAIFIGIAVLIRVVILTPR
jgi:hypothetical protein